MKTTTQVFIGVFLALIGFKMFNNMVNPPLTPEQKAVMEFERKAEQLVRDQKYYLEQLQESSDRINEK